ncbi:MAG: hypothetical protein VKJ02_00995 [Snowella sp.]|nr:hypothetical protein [Snowella sp.]
MHNPINQKLLGILLREAHLISDFQFQIALVDQKAYGMALGDILVLHGWIQPQTIDFFLYRWNQLLEKSWEYSLASCLYSAGLLDEQQIQAIWQEQAQSNLSFDRIVIQKKWLHPYTVEFFQAALSQNQLMAS